MLEVNDKVYSIDWLRMTSDCFILVPGYDFPDNDGIKFFNNFMRTLHIDKQFHDFNVEYYGKYGYKKTIFIEEGISLLYDSKFNLNKNGNPTCCLDISGTGCDFFKSKEAWLELLEFLLDYGFVATRTDPNFDDFYGKELTLEYIYNAIINGNYKKKGSWVPEIIGKCNNSIDGSTINIYSRISEFGFRIYDKAFERKVKTDYLADTPQWVRYELELKKKHAHSFIKKFYLLLKENKESEISQLIASYMDNYFQILVPNPNDSNKSRWDVDPKWKAFICSAKDMSFDRKIVKASTIESVKFHIEQSYSKAFARILLTKGTEFFNIWARNLALIGFSQLNDKYIHEINNLRLKNGLEKLSKDDISDIYINEFLTDNEYTILKSWGTDQNYSNKDINYYETLALLDSILYDLDRSKLNEGQLLIKSSDIDLINNIKKYLGG